VVGWGAGSVVGQDWALCEALCFINHPSNPPLHPHNRSVWGILVNFEKAGKHKQQQQQQADDDGDGSAYKGSSNSGDPRFTVDVLVCCDPATLPKAGGSGARALPALLPPGSAGCSAHVVTFPLEHLAALSSARMKGLQDLRAPQARAAAMSGVAEVIRRSQQRGGGDPPVLDPQRDMKVGGGVLVVWCCCVAGVHCCCTARHNMHLCSDPLNQSPPRHNPPHPLQPTHQIGGKDITKLVSRLESHDSRIAAHALATAPDLSRRLGALQAKQLMAAAARLMRKEVKLASGLVLGDELQSRQRCLRRLGYVDAEGLVTTKGRVAADLQVCACGVCVCEVRVCLGGSGLLICFPWSFKPLSPHRPILQPPNPQSGDELVLTEMIFGGAFNGLTTEQIVAVASCFVWTEKNEAGTRLPKELKAALRVLQDTARRVGNVAEECKIAIDVPQYVESFRCVGVLVGVCRGRVEGWKGGVSALKVSTNLCAGCMRNTPPLPTPTPTTDTDTPTAPTGRS